MIEEMRANVVVVNAILIQKMVKGRLERKRFQKWKRACLLVQTKMRGAIARIAMAHLRNRSKAALIIQCAVRNWRARMTFVKLREEMDRQNGVITLQCWWRCVLARLKVFALRRRLRLCIRLQAWFRGRSVRIQIQAQLAKIQAERIALERQMFEGLLAVLVHAPQEKKRKLSNIYQVRAYAATRIQCIVRKFVRRCVFQRLLKEKRVRDEQAKKDEMKREKEKERQQAKKINALVPHSTVLNTPDASDKVRVRTSERKHAPQPILPSSPEQREIAFSPKKILRCVPQPAPTDDGRASALSPNAAHLSSSNPTTPNTKRQSPGTSSQNIPVAIAPPVLPIVTAQSSTSSAGAAVSKGAGPPEDLDQKKPSTPLSDGNGAPLASASAPPPSTGCGCGAGCSVM